METKWWYKTIRWFAGFFEDQKSNGGSSKRISLFVALVFLKNLIDQAPTITNDSYQAYQMALWTVGVIILFLLGAITSEFFAKNPIPLVSNMSKTTNTTEETIVKTTENK